MPTTDSATIPSVRGAQHAPALELAGARLDGVAGRIGRGASAAVPAGSLAAVRVEGESAGRPVLELLAGRRDPSEGALRIEGVELGALRRIQRARLVRERIGLVDQRRLLAGGRTVRENLELPFALAGREIGERDRVRLDGLVASLSLGDELDRYPHELCHVRAHRAAIASALALSPAVLIVDLPGEDRRTQAAAAADPALAEEISRGRRTMLAVVRAFAVDQGLACLAVTAFDDPAEIADHLIDLRDAGARLQAVS